MPLNFRESADNSAAADASVTASAEVPYLRQARLLGWLPILLLLLAMAALWKADLRNDYEAPYFLEALNFVPRTLASLFIVSLASQSFLAGGRPGSLLLGCGMAIWGTV